MEREKKQQPVGRSPREALNAWNIKTGLLRDSDGASLELSAGAANTVIATACETFLGQVKASKSRATHDAYAKDLEWFRRHIVKHYVSAVTREDMLRLIGIGRKERLNQKRLTESHAASFALIAYASAYFKVKYLAAFPCAILNNQPMGFSGHT